MIAPDIGWSMTQQDGGVLIELDDIYRIDVLQIWNYFGEDAIRHGL